VSDAFSQGILLDSFYLTIIALVVGLVTFTFVRVMNPLLRWNEHGNVWTGPFRFEDLIVVFLLVGWFSLQVLGALSAAASVTPDTPPPTLTSDALLLSLVTQIATVGAVLFFLLYLRKIEVAELFGLTRMPLRTVLIKSILVMIPVFVIVAIVGHFTITLFFQKEGGAQPETQLVIQAFLKNPDPILRGLIVISACIVAPVCEEILFRGFLYPAIKKHSERFFATLVVSLLFAVVHMNAPALPALFVLAIFLTIAYEITGSILVPICMHAIFNGVQTSLLFYQAKQ
jgi:membrane protease YdiL (CAAX protease family)